MSLMLVVCIHYACMRRNIYVRVCASNILCVFCCGCRFLCLCTNIYMCASASGYPQPFFHQQRRHASKSIICEVSSSSSTSVTSSTSASSSSSSPPSPSASSSISPPASAVCHCSGLWPPSGPPPSPTPLCDCCCCCGCTSKPFTIFSMLFSSDGELDAIGFTMLPC